MAGRETPVYKLPFEKISDQPGISLHGGLTGTENILAEKVEEQIIRLDQEVTDAADAHLQRGWHDITPAGGTLISENTSFAIQTGVYDMVRVYCRGNMTDEAFLMLRVNADSTSELHRFGRRVFNFETGAVDRNSTQGSAGWPMALWGSSNAGFHTAQAILYRTNITASIGYQAWGTRVSGNPNFREETTVSGDLDSSRLLESINIRAFPASPGEVNQIRVWIEGHKS